MIASLADAWQWYTSARRLAQAMLALGKKHWGSLPWGGSLGQDNRLRDLEASVVQDWANVTHMGKITGFLEIEREDRAYEPASDRIRHWREFVIPPSEADITRQAARCMDCGIPYCHTGCPVNNQIPDCNDLVYHSDWQVAAENLHSTNNFPEVTGRICPAPCEAACTLNIIDVPVTIKSIECAIADKAFEEGWVQPRPPEVGLRHAGRHAGGVQRVEVVHPQAAAR